jgi:hypothetical protein
VAFGIPGALMLAATVIFRSESIDLGAASEQMLKPTWFASSQMQALNPALVMLLIPFNNLVLVAFLMFFFAGSALLVAVLFGLYARGYPMQDHYRAE